MSCLKDFTNQVQTLKNQFLKQTTDRNSCNEGRTVSISFVLVLLHTNLFNVDFVGVISKLSAKVIISLTDADYRFCLFFFTPYINFIAVSLGCFDEWLEMLLVSKFKRLLI